MSVEKFLESFVFMLVARFSNQYNKVLEVDIAGLEIVTAPSDVAIRTPKYSSYGAKATLNGRYAGASMTPVACRRSEYPADVAHRK
jgi:hypothetical protein